MKEKITHFCKNRFIKILFATYLVASTFFVSGQVTFKGLLLSKQDSLPIPYTVVKLAETGVFTETKNNGEFKFKIPADATLLHFEIFAIGLRDTVAYQRAFRSIEKIYIERSPLNLSTVNIKGLSAKETVKKAVSLIPVNYTDSSFAGFSFYRQYEKINGEFKNLIEVQAVVSFILNTSKKTITSKYGFAIDQIRKSDYVYPIDDFAYDDLDFSALLDENPVYNVQSSSLNPNAFNFYSFNFDTASNTDDYVINYICLDFSSETHGVSNIRDADWHGESWEEGQFVIDSKTFAFRKILRTAYRNKGFHYPRHNNFLLPSKRYYEEFVDGKLVAEYQLVKGKWFLKSLCHRYTNDYYQSSTAKKEFTVTEVFEWHCDSISHFINTELANRFYNDTPLPLNKGVYNKSKWDKPLPPFYFFKKDEVYRDLEKQSALEEQFMKNGVPR